MAEYHNDQPFDPFASGLTPDDFLRAHEEEQRSLDIFEQDMQEKCQETQYQLLSSIHDQGYNTSAIDTMLGKEGIETVKDVAMKVDDDLFYLQESGEYETETIEKLKRMSLFCRAIAEVAEDIILLPHATNNRNKIDVQLYIHGFEGLNEEQKNVLIRSVDAIVEGRSLLDLSESELRQAQEAEQLRDAEERLSHTLQAQARKILETETEGIIPNAYEDRERVISLMARAVVKDHIYGDTLDKPRLARWMELNQELTKLGLSVNTSPIKELIAEMREALDLGESE